MIEDIWLTWQPLLRIRRILTYCSKASKRLIKSAMSIACTLRTWLEVLWWGCGIAGSAVECLLFMTSDSWDHGQGWNLQRVRCCVDETDCLLPKGECRTGRWSAAPKCTLFNHYEDNSSHTEPIVSRRRKLEPRSLEVSNGATFWTKPLPQVLKEVILTHLLFLLSW